MRSGEGTRSATVTVGREAEVDTLLRAVEGVRAKRSSCTLLVGEGGVGKTRLLAEATQAARRIGVAVAAGRAGISTPSPFALISEALRSRLRGHPVTLPPSPFDLGVRMILPEWGCADQDSDLAAGQLRLLALEGTVRLLREVADRSGGVVLVLDDVHAADPDSVEVVRYVASADIDGLAIVAAMRPGESRHADELARGLRGREAHVIELDALPHRAVTDLVTHLLDAVPPTELITDVLTRTEGLPLFVEEVVAAHLRAGSVILTGGSAHWRGGTVAMPRSVRGMVEEKLGALLHPVSDVLLAVAVIGPSEPTAIIAAVAGTDEEAVPAALRRGVDVGVLATSSGTVRFRHDLIREAVLDIAVPHVVVAMHRRAADALMGEQAQARRAEHMAAAGSEDEAADLFAGAAIRELDSHALLDAERLARRAVALARSARVRAAGADALAAVLAAQGRWTEALEIDEETVRSSGDTSVRRHRMAAAALEAGYPDRARAALARSDDDQPLSRLLDARVALVGGDAVDAVGQADAVLAGPVDTDTRLAALDIQARALDFMDRRAEAAAAWSTLAAEADAAGRTQARLRALLQLGKQDFFMGRGPDRLREAVAVAAAAGALVELAWAEETLAIALTLHGDPQAGLDILGPAIDRTRALRLDQLGFLLVAQAGALSLLGSPAEAAFAEAEAVAPAPDLHMSIASIRADLALGEGRYEDAVSGFQRADQLMSMMPGVAPMDSSCYLIWALAAAGRMDEARAALERASAMPDLARWYPRPVLVSAARALLDGDAAGVDAAIAAAVGPMPFVVAMMRTIGAQVLGGQVTVAWLREALDIYQATGAVTYRDRARRLLRDAGGPVPRRRVPTTPVPPALTDRGVTARESEVLRLLGQGLSNADIASALFLSVRTVETHVSSLLAKLNVRGRGNLIALSSTMSFVPPT
jgi:DNA-binding NarL/FixJ family response regulator